MAEDLKQWIESKLGTGEVVEIIYMGGSHPGARRKLVLSKLEDNDRKVRCVEVGHSGISKSFMVDKILRIDTMSPDQLAAIQPEKTFNNLDELYAGCLEKKTFQIHWPSTTTQKKRKLLFRSGRSLRMETDEKRN